MRDLSIPVLFINLDQAPTVLRSCAGKLNASGWNQNESQLWTRSTYLTIWPAILLTFRQADCPSSMMAQSALPDNIVQVLDELDVIVQTASRLAHAHFAYVFIERDSKFHLVATNQEDHDVVRHVRDRLERREFVRLLGETRCGAFYSKAKNRAHRAYLGAGMSLA